MCSLDIRYRLRRGIEGKPKARKGKLCAKLAVVGLIVLVVAKFRLERYKIFFISLMPTIEIISLGE